MNQITHLVHIEPLDPNSTFAPTPSPGLKLPDRPVHLLAVAAQGAILTEVINHLDGCAFFVPLQAQQTLNDRETLFQTLGMVDGQQAHLVIIKLPDREAKSRTGFRVLV